MYSSSARSTEELPPTGDTSLDTDGVAATVNTWAAPDIIELPIDEAAPAVLDATDIAVLPKEEPLLPYCPCHELLRSRFTFSTRVWEILEKLNCRSTLDPLK